ncbi:MAG: OmpA family protein [Spirochaetales bacterium]|nr:OmpA family protein [Spirochaetales bacterium]
MKKINHFLGRLAYCILPLVFGLIFSWPISAQVSIPAKIIQRYDERRFVDGHYAGLFYGLDSVTWTPNAKGPLVHHMLAQESRLNLDHEIPLQLDETVRYEPNRTFSFDQDFPPALPEKLVKQQSWLTKAFLVPDLGETNPVALPVKLLCTYMGQADYQGKRVYQVSLRSQFDAPGITGLRSTTIYYDIVTRQPLFGLSRINDSWAHDGKILRNEGFHLYFFFYDHPYQVPQTAQTLSKQLQTTAPNVRVTSTSNGVKLVLDNLGFEPDQAILLPGEDQRLKAISNALKTMKGRTIRVVGYTADVGNPEGELKLSWSRALTIVHELEKRGIPDKALVYEGRGARDPVASNATPQGREQNRRVEITILQQ